MARKVTKLKANRVIEGGPDELGMATSTWNPWHRGYGSSVLREQGVKARSHLLARGRIRKQVGKGHRQIRRATGCLHSRTLRLSGAAFQPQCKSVDSPSSLTPSSQCSKVGGGPGSIRSTKCVWAGRM